MKKMVILLSFIWSVVAVAAIPAKKLDGFISKGSVIGGLAGIGFSLTNFQINKLPNNVERWVFEVSDVNGKKIIGYPGYYHLEMKQNPAKLVLDFAQMPKISMEEIVLKRKLQSSKFVKAASLALDPEDTALNLTLDLTGNPKVKVYQVPGKQFTSKVVIDVRSAE